MNPGIAGGSGLPLMVTKRAVDDGLNWMSDTVSGGPVGGVLAWRSLRGRRPPIDMRPRPYDTEKQAIPFLAPPLTTQAINGDLVSVGVLGADHSQTYLFEGELSRSQISENRPVCLLVHRLVWDESGPRGI